MMILIFDCMTKRAPTASNVFEAHIVTSVGVQNSATGTRTRVARVRAEYPNQLDYSGSRK